MLDEQDLPNDEQDEQDGLTGVFLYRVPEDTWWWSEEMFGLLGYEVDEVTPTGALLFKHVHPDDRGGVEQALERGRRTGNPFGYYHRVRTAQGDERHAVLVGDGRTKDGEVVAVRGFSVDVTAAVSEESRRTASGDIERARASQADIDLARGVLMGLYGVNQDVAFRVLRRHSQQTNVKLRTLAQSVVEAAPTPPGEAQHDLHHRIAQALYPETSD
ncbi:PAS and ANTAR domain-containing protein [Streptomyces fructofermentans]|uniref:ANTAR domain-containing protein n=1 Tax=Streptomyces fructofermentans TaxID=152141 RepID=A0A918KNP6_9ACTN|nr:PAS and ANTAR domain-containing protein [Streptomyces fructofermentans]GGX69984.1 hypothetical protein GCM10010515_42040 [Streptomyces fructofermentans]